MGNISGQLAYINKVDIKTSIISKSNGKEYSSIEKAKKELPLNDSVMVVNNIFVEVKIEAVAKKGDGVSSKSQISVETPDGKNIKSENIEYGPYSYISDVIKIGFNATSHGMLSNVGPAVFTVNLINVFKKYLHGLFGWSNQYVNCDDKEVVNGLWVYN